MLEDPSELPTAEQTQVGGDFSLLEESEGDSFFEEETESPILVDSSISQQTIRSHSDGMDCLCVTSRVQIPAGSDRVVMHVPIHPPFAESPNTEAFVISGQELRIRITCQERFGLRLELILPRPSDELTESIIEIISSSKDAECQPRQEAA